MSLGPKPNPVATNKTETEFEIRLKNTSVASAFSNEDRQTLSWAIHALELPRVMFLGQTSRKVTYGWTTRSTHLKTHRPLDDGMGHLEHNPPGSSSCDRNLCVEKHPSWSRSFRMETNTSSSQTLVVANRIATSNRSWTMRTRHQGIHPFSRQKLGYQAKNSQ